MSLKKLKAFVLGHGKPSSPDNTLYTTLAASGIPVTAADCRTCSNPCDQGRFLTQALGISSKTFHRHGVNNAWHSQAIPAPGQSPHLSPVNPFSELLQILISTGLSDWDREVTDTPGSLAALISQTQPPKVPDTPAAISVDDNEKSVPPVPGIFSSTESTRLSILNGSHKTLCTEDNRETVLVLPDYTVVTNVPATLDGAKELWRIALNPQLPRMGVTEETSSFQTWVLPYSCVIMLCSHKRRDNRCAIAAPKLEHAFIECLHRKGWTTDTQLEHIIQPSLESFAGTAEEKALHVRKELTKSSHSKKALIIQNSHIGGHRYAGNCIIYTPPRLVGVVWEGEHPRGGGYRD
ncbi:Altered inheritance of mitochondria protein 32 [Mycena sanguinolenta]|uniref:Altered inheritance of mitochondria protein 32 n=1 Tax=Mycena sanguinolenta TaxID=230812 RepID=A0A8H6YB46_9AGAR|nr:Altered inheritance of mitochondria protein 32 [Mycena sanguinolenta]